MPTLHNSSRHFKTSWITKTTFKDISWFKDLWGPCIAMINSNMLFKRSPTSFYLLLSIIPCLCFLHNVCFYISWLQTGFPTGDNKDTLHFSELEPHVNTDSTTRSVTSAFQGKYYCLHTTRQMIHITYTSYTVSCSSSLTHIHTRTHLSCCAGWCVIYCPHPHTQK